MSKLLSYFYYNIILSFNFNFIIIYSNLMEPGLNYDIKSFIDQNQNYNQNCVNVCCEKKKDFTKFLQNELKDTVVQVFSQITAFNWLEPYKSPMQAEATGSAFFIDGDGRLITNAHVVEQAKGIFIQVPSSGKRRYEVEIVGVNPERDIALLKLKDSEKEILKKELKIEKIPYLEFGNCDLVTKAEKVFALGYPLGEQGLKSTKGVVSGRAHILGQHYIQIDAPINRGNSGGPSVDKDGKVIGINSAAHLDAQNVGYIVPINDVKIFLDQLQSMPAPKEPNVPKLVYKPYLGVIFSNAYDNLTKFLGNPMPGGLYIVDIYKKSPLDKAGLKSGDMIYKMNGIPVDIYGEMYAPWNKEDKSFISDYVARLKIGQKVTIEYYRNGAKRKTSFIFDYSEKPPIRKMYPGYEKIDYEVIGGLVVMPLTINHVALLVQHVPELISYADMKKNMEPALIITHIMLNSPASKTRSISAGTIISEVNGQKVKTLQEFRNAIKNPVRNEYITVKTTENLLLVLTLKEVLENEENLSKTYYYPLSETYKYLENKYKKDLIL